MSDLAIRFEEAQADGTRLFTHLEAIRKDYKLDAKTVAKLYSEWLAA